jgi:hypothetical protein
MCLRTLNFRTLSWIVLRLFWPHQFDEKTVLMFTTGIINSENVSYMEYHRNGNNSVMYRQEDTWAKRPRCPVAFPPPRSVPCRWWSTWFSTQRNGSVCVCSGAIQNVRDKKRHVRMLMLQIRQLRALTLNFSQFYHNIEFHKRRTLFLYSDITY